MAVEIKVFKKQGAIEPGNYPARILTNRSADKGFGSLTFPSLFLSDKNAALPAQIIDGPHAGEVVPFENYLEIGKLPAQSDVLQQNTRMIEQVAEAGRKIVQLREENQKLRSANVGNFAVISGQIERIRNLEEELESRVKKVDLQLQEVFSDWQRIKGSTFELIKYFCDYTQEREGNERPF